MPAVLHKRGDCQTARMPSESMRGIPRSHRYARSRPLTLKRRGRARITLRAASSCGAMRQRASSPLREA